MSLTDDFDDDDFPILEKVVKPGNIALIEAVRATHKAASEPAKNDAVQLTPAALSRSITAPRSNPQPLKHGENVTGAPTISEAQLEKLIDEIVDRHANEMRNELRTILKHRA